MLLHPEEAATLAGSPVARADLSALRGRAMVAVDLRGGDRGVDLVPLQTLPVVAVGVGPAHAALDVTLDSPDGLDHLATAVGRNPVASVTLVQLLRLSERLDPANGLVAESLAYATLQGGQEFLAWLSTRGRRVRHPEPEPVIAERRDGVLRLELNRPRLHNLYSAAMRDALGEILAAAGADPGIERIELAGRGPSFCAGGDLGEFGSTADPATAHLVRSTANVAPHLLAVAERLHVELHGAAVGAGIELAAFAGRVTATEDTVIHLPEVAMGLVPGAGGTVSIPRRVGRHRAGWLMLTGARIDARQAHAWGLVDEIVRGAR